MAPDLLRSRHLSTFIFNATLDGDSRPAYTEVAYDPTNGTLGAGDIERNQKFPDGFNPS